MKCIFCNIINKSIPAKIVGENEKAIAFLDANPISDAHTIVIPKNHYKDLSSCPVEDLKAVIELVHQVSNKIKKSKLDPYGFNYLSNEGSIAGQEVMHLHIHIIPKYAKHEGLKLSVGSKYVDSIDTVFDKLKKI
jgi:histidine triad (HIT) family protein